ncbi:MAG: hypothetical protein AAB576_06995 [Elusimicrobiota bacterium]
MDKKRTAAPSGKRLKPTKAKSPIKDGDPEWEDVQERFRSLNSDFSKLAQMVARE